MIPRALCAALLCLGLLVPPPAVAFEPVTVDVEGVVPDRGGARRAAISEALLEAVVQIAAGFLPTMELSGDLDGVRDALRPFAAEMVLTYRVQPAMGTRPSLEDPNREVYFVRATVTVDAARVRAKVRELGLEETNGRRPSVALFVRDDRPTPYGVALPIGRFENTLRERLEAEQFVVVEPALRPLGGRDPESALELARAVGADVAIAVRLGWRERAVASRVVGGIASADVSAERVFDGREVARARFESPAYHADPAQAAARGLDALEEQVSRSLLLQLDRNWEALEQSAGPIRLVLVGVSGYGQVDAVRNTLENVLGAEQARLMLFAPRVAELDVMAPLSPGALQDRLVAVPFEGFRLEPVQVTKERVELRVSAAAAANPGP